MRERVMLKQSIEANTYCYRDIDGLIHIADSVERPSLFLIPISLERGDIIEIEIGIRVLFIKPIPRIEYPANHPYRTYIDYNKPEETSNEE